MGQLESMTRESPELFSTSLLPSLFEPLTTTPSPNYGLLNNGYERSVFSPPSRITQKKLTSIPLYNEQS